MPQAPGNTPEQDEFESAFTAFAAEKTSAADTQAAPATEPYQSADTGTAPAAEPQAARAPATSDDSKPEPSAAEPDLASRLQESEQRARSSEGRLSAFSRQVQEAEARARAAERALATERQARAAAAPAPVATPPEDEDDILKQSPELRTAIERRVAKALAPVQTALEQATARLAQIDETANTAARHVEPLVARHAQQEMDATHRRLDEAFPAWRDIVQSGNFKTWLNEQPKQVKQLYEEGASFDEAAVVLKLFNAGTPSAAPAAAAPAAPTSKTTVINPDRVRAAVGIRPTTPPRPATVPEDFEGAFAVFAQQIAKR